jgi:hypothetical protein
MSPDINITTTTNQYLAPAWVDQVLKDNLFFGEVLSNVESWDGSQMLFPIKYQKGVASVAFNGFDELPTSQQPVSVNMTFYTTFTATNVALAGSDLSINKTKEQKLNLMKIMMKSRAQDGADDIGTYFQSDGTANGGKAPSGLANIVDDGTTASTYGGLSRATYAGLNATSTASGGTISLLKIRQLWNNVSDGKVSPDLGLTTYTVWAYIEQLMMPFQRNTYTNFQNMDAGTGFASKGLLFDGITIYRDKKVTSGIFYLINKNYLKFYGLNWWEGEPVQIGSKEIKGNIYEYTNPASAAKAFTWTNWVRAYNAAAVNGFMIMGGQLICTDPFRNGKLTGVTGI